MEDLILSSSSLKLFRECRRAYKFGYVDNLDPITTRSVAAEDGTSVHEYLALAAMGNTEWENDVHWNPMAAVAFEYLQWNQLPRDIISAERSAGQFFVKLAPHTYVRCTFDLVYRTPMGVVVRDYKTFAKMPDMRLSLDFQGRFYIAAAQKHFKCRVDFEYEYIRRELYHQKGGSDDLSNPWTNAERYVHFPLNISAREAREVWNEAVETARDIRRALASKRGSVWYHNDRKGFGGCGSCFYRDICETENEQGGLSPTELQRLSVPRPRLQME